MRCKPAIVALVFAACGPNVAPVAELGELCGQEAPVKLLDLEEGQYFWSIHTARAGSERIVVAVDDRDPQGDAWYEIAGTTLWSVGSCGEDPRVLATDATLLQWPEHFLGDSGGLVLACMVASGDVVVLDPSGRDEPATLFAGTQCNPWWTVHGAFELREHDEDAAIVLYPYPDELRAGPVAPRSLVESVRLGGLQWAVLRDEVLVVSSDDTLLRVGLPQGDVSVEQTGVRAFTATNERIVWQELGSGSIGRVFLRDRATSEDRFLVETDLFFNPHGLFTGADDVLPIGLGLWPSGPQRVFFLPTLEFVDLPEGEVLKWHIEGDRWVTQEAGGQSFVRDLRAGEREVFFDRRAEVFPTEGGAQAYGGALCCGFNTLRETGPMWFVPYEGSPRKLAERVSLYRVRSSDEPIMTVLDLDDEQVGSLFAIDPESLAEQLVDRRVVGPSVGISSRLFDDDSMIYGVLDGDRSGVWRTRLAPPG
jgi:hypothetical protein